MAKDPKRTDLEQDAPHYRALIDGEWSLLDLYEFPHSYSQVYAFIYCLDTAFNPRDRARIGAALEEYPWLGGYSYINIYTVLQNQVPSSQRPRIRSMRKSSPGWIDLYLNVEVALQVAEAVGLLGISALVAADTYRRINKSLAKMNLERRSNQLEEMRLTRLQANEVTAMCADLAKFLGFKSIKELHQYTGNPEVTLKLLLAHYRRLSILAKYVDEGKLSLPQKFEN
jgi:hypothetical protein